MSGRVILSKQKEKKCKEIELLLRIIYIKLDEICGYLKESNYSRKQMLESLFDVEKEADLEQGYEDILKHLENSGKNRRGYSKRITK